VASLPVGRERRDCESVRRRNTSARLRGSGAEKDSVCALEGSNSIDARLPPGRVCCAVELSKAVSPPAARDRGESGRDDQR
jgi:hypothetical protein